jgi:carboxymethylenebutenolidase
MGMMSKPDLQRYLDALNPMQRYLVTEFVDNFEDGLMSRRDLLERVYRITGSVAAAAGTLLALGCAPATSGAPAAATATRAPAPTAGATAATAAGTLAGRSPLSVAANDPAVVAGPVTFPSGDATIMAYLARPAGTGQHGAVMICHENRGTGPHYEDVARRFAKAGFVGISLDLLSRQGGTAAVPANQVGAAISGQGAAERFVGDFQAAMAYLRQQAFVDGDRIGMTGYCFGGGATLNVAAREPSLRAAVPYYGTPAFPDELKNAKAAVLGVYGETDARVNASIPTVEQNLSAAGVPFQVKVYPGAGHAFFNDTGGSYNEAAATAAWKDTLDWLKAHMGA